MGSELTNGIHVNYPHVVMSDTDAKLQETREKVECVTQIMRQNVALALGRGEALNSLDAKAEDLSNVADEFRVNAQKLRNAMWWRKVRSTMTLLLVVVIVVGLLTIVLYFGSR